MSINIVVPEMGESIVDARVAKWLKNEGDSVEVGEALVELETDKVDVEVSAPKRGVLAKIAHGKGDDVKIGDVLGMIEEGATTGTTGRQVRQAPAYDQYEVRGTTGTTGTNGYGDAQKTGSRGGYAIGDGSWPVKRMSSSGQ